MRILKICELHKEKEMVTNDNVTPIKSCRDHVLELQNL